MSRKDYDFGQVNITIKYNCGSRERVLLNEIPFPGPYNYKFGVSQTKQAKDLDHLKQKISDTFRPRNRSLIDLTVFPDFKK